jgi:site-specific DNA-methyltransferase (adenine-specific)
MDVLGSSARDDWATPQALFDALDAEFAFDLDAAATERTAKGPNWFGPGSDEAEDALCGSAPWVHYNTVWLNPPYGRAVAAFVEKAREESTKGATVVCLVNAKTDTRWWHDSVMQADEVRLIQGRVSFIDPDTGEPRHPSPYPSAVVIFRPHWSGPPRFVSWRCPR